MKKKVTFQTDDGTCDAYVSFPDQQKNLPIVLVYMDAIGIRWRMYDMADKIAERGYYVLLPNLYYRQKAAPVVDYDFYLKPENFPQLIPNVMAFAKELNPELSKRDVAAFLKFARQQPEVNSKKVGAVGYCMGGGQVLRAAGNFPDDIQAAASFHAGNLHTDTETSPHRWFPKIKAEVYIGHADKDQHMPPEQMEKVSADLKSANVKFTAEVYLNSPHGWTMSDLPAYNEQGEEKHWQELFGLFDRTLKH